MTGRESDQKTPGSSSRKSSFFSVKGFLFSGQSKGSGSESSFRDREGQRPEARRGAHSHQEQHGGKDSQEKLALGPSNGFPRRLTWINRGDGQTRDRAIVLNSGSLSNTWDEGDDEIPAYPGILRTTKLTINAGSQRRDVSPPRPVYMPP